MEQAGVDFAGGGGGGHSAEAAELFDIEILVLGEAGERAADLHGRAGGEIGEHRGCAWVRNAHAAHAGVHIELDLDGPAGFGGDGLETPAGIVGVDAKLDVARGEFEFLRWSGAGDEQDGFPDAGGAQAEAGLGLDVGEADDLWHVLDQACDNGVTDAVAVVLHDGHHGLTAR